jgi:hypothetical protein
VTEEPQTVLLDLDVGVPIVVMLKVVKDDRHYLVRVLQVT